MTEKRCRIDCMRVKLIDDAQKLERHRIYFTIKRLGGVRKLPNIQEKEEQVEVVGWKEQQ